VLDGIEIEYAKILNESVVDPSEIKVCNKKLCQMLRKRVEILKGIADKNKKI